MRRRISSAYYAPNNLTACIVGDFDPGQATALARKYFGRLQRGSRDPEPVRTVEESQHGERRMSAYAETNPQTIIRYHTVADHHKDEPALLMLGSILSGRTGRLYKALVLDQQVASEAMGGNEGMKYEGYFELRGVARPGKTPEQVEQAIYAEIEKIKTEPVPERELQKVKNEYTASNFRGLQSDFSLMMRLLTYDAYLGWRTINSEPALLDAVTAADIQRVARKYFVTEGRNVLTLYRKTAASAGGSN